MALAALPPGPWALVPPETPGDAIIVVDAEGNAIASVASTAVAALLVAAMKAMLEQTQPRVVLAS